MLGPNDIDDWEFDSTDLVRAELRLIPLVREIADPASPAAQKSPDQIRKLCGKLINGDPLEDAELNQLNNEFNSPVH